MAKLTEAGMEEKSYIPLLSELTEKLSAYPRGQGPSEFVYGGRPGVPEFTGRSLYKTDEIAILRVHMPEGARLPEHRHSEKEWLICFHGSFHFSIDGEDSILGIGACRYIPENKAHNLRALEESELIAITIPADPEFPDA